jgi:hypothetical protein
MKENAVLKEFGLVVGVLDERGGDPLLQGDITICNYYHYAVSVCELVRLWFRILESNITAERC